MSAVTSSLASAVSTAIASATRIPVQRLEDMPPEFLKYRQEVKDSIISLFTPLNFTIITVIGTLLYYRLRTASPLTIDAQKPLVFRTFTPRTLLHFNGTPSKPWNPDGAVYLAVKGKVYDVTAGRNFYGPGGPYENFAGRDATRGLACQSFDEDMLTKDLDGPVDDCADLKDEELSNLQGWVEKFDEKYLIVGKLTAYQEILAKSQLQP